MSKKKKILIGIGIYLLICGIIYSIVFTSRMNYINESYLKEFRKSPVLKEKFGEIIKTKSGVLVDEYDDEKYVVDIKIYTKDNKKYKIQAIYYISSSELYAYLIDGELVYENEMERYAEIRESVKKASEHYLRALNPNCSISNENGETNAPGTAFNASWLLSNGLIKKNELLDIDKKSYCDVHVKSTSYFENPLDYQRNCAVYYQIYLKCKNYEDKGYVAY